MRSLLAAVCLAAAILISGCGSDEEITMFIGPELRPCQAVGPTVCMQQASGPQGPWTHFYGEIEGFTYRPGFVHELRVRVVEVPNPPADGSSLRYILIRVVSTTPSS